MKVGIAQIAPVWLDRDKTIERIVESISKAADEGCLLVAFGEGLLPGYPFWLEHTNGAQFNNQIQKELFAHYVSQAIEIDKGHLDKICAIAQKRSIAIYLGIIERTADRGHSLYASLVYINTKGEIDSVQRKLCPTYEERLVWSPGDGNGLQTHELHEFTVGGLNCWENWMPLTRTALYAQGENLHVAVWPGSVHNTEDISRFMAKEGRSYVLSVSGLMSKKDIAEGIPHYDLLQSSLPEKVTNGGSCLVGPDGNFIIEPVVDEEGIFTAEMAIERVYEERQNFDAVGHYSRPDVLSLNVDTKRQSVLQKPNH